MKASDIMTWEVMTIEDTSTVADAVRLMLKEHISGLPVVNSKRQLVGIVTEGDFLRRAEIGTQRRRSNWLELFAGPGHLADDFVRTHTRKISDVMTVNVVAVTEDTPLDEIVHLMESRRIKRVPVVRGGTVIGIVSRANLLRALAGIVGEVRAPLSSDAAIRARILSEMKSEKWAPQATIDVTVRDGVVQLWGTIFDERERLALKVMAENVPGVKSVEDHLYWVGPFPGMIVDIPEQRPEEKLPADSR